MSECPNAVKPSQSHSTIIKKTAKSERMIFFMVCLQPVVKNRIVSLIVCKEVSDGLIDNGVKSLPKIKPLQSGRSSSPGTG